MHAARPELSNQHFKAAAHKGHVDSVFELAFQYEQCIGTEANTDHALAYYRVAAVKNHLKAHIIWPFCCHAATM